MDMLKPYISKDHLEALLLIGLQFAELNLNNITQDELEDMQSQTRLIYQRLLDGDKDDFTLDELNDYIINLDIYII